MRVLHPLLLGAAVAVSGCSLTLDFDCSDDSDCANLEGSFICADGACVADENPEPEPGGFACEDGEMLLNDSCTDLFGPLAGQEGMSSQDRLAALLASPDDFELIAVQVPSGPVVSTNQERIRAAIHHAVDHINTSGGLTYGEGLGQKKRLAALICADALSDGSVSGGIAAAEHAVGCKAKALVSTYVSGLTVDIFREVAKEHDVPMIAPGAISPQIPLTRDALGDEGLLWRIKVPGSTLVRSVVGLVDALDYQNIHVFFRPTIQYDTAMAEQLDLRLGQERTTLYELTGTAGASADAVAQYLLDLAEGDKPDLVVTVVEDLADLVDVAFGVVTAGSADPGLLFDLITVEGARSAQAAGVVASSGDHLRMSCRAMGISSGSTNGGATDYWKQQLGLASAKYGLSADDVENGLPAPTPAYVDAVFVTAYALASALRTGGGDATTAGIIDGLKLLSDANGDEILPLQWSVGLRLIGEDGRGQMNYNGASGSIDLDQATQDVTGRKTEIWQYAFDDGATVNELTADLVADDAEDYTPSQDAIDDLRNNTPEEGRASCADFPYAGLSDG